MEFINPKITREKPIVVFQVLIMCFTSKLSEKQILKELLQQLTRHDNPLSESKLISQGFPDCKVTWNSSLKNSFMRTDVYHIYGARFFCSFTYLLTCLCEVCNKTCPNYLRR